MNRKILFAAIIGILFNVSCGGQATSGLLITVIPQQPYAIPFGSATVNGAVLAAPYFILNNINLTWTGPSTTTVEVLTLLIQTPTTGGGTGTGTTTINCGFAGDQLNASFPNSVQNGNVIVTNANTAKSVQMGCGGFMVPNPIPAVLGATANVTVVAITLDQNNNPTGRIQASQSITIQ